MPAVGDRIGSYLITGIIGRGAMASVYRAHDERLNRDVALKVLDPGYSLDFIFRARFEREYGVTARLHNDHNIPVYDAGAWNEQLYIAMMLVDGPNLGEVLKAEGPLELARVVAIVSQVAEALDEAHAERVIHRDVKPANILLTRHGSSGTEHAYLADFGLTLGMEGTHLTRTGGFMGTLAYSSPEQLNSAPIDGRSDQYALAATCFQMLAGDPPFRRDNEVALINAHLFDPPPTLTDIRPDLPPRVSDVIARGMAKLPEDRYRSAGEFARALTSASAPVLAAGAAFAGSRRFGRSTQAVLVLGLILIAGLGGAVAMAVLSANLNQPATTPGSAGPTNSLVAGVATTAPATATATATETFPPPTPVSSPGLPSTGPGPGRTPRPTDSTSATPTPGAATPAPAGPTQTPPPASLPLVADGSWSVGNSPSGTSGDPYFVVGQHQRRYQISSACVSDADCRLAVDTFDSDGARLGSIVLRWDGSSYVYRGAARWYSRSGGSMCETTAGDLVEDAYTTREEVLVSPPAGGGIGAAMTGTKTISGTPTGAGEAAGCAPFEMTYNVAMSLT